MKILIYGAKGWIASLLTNIWIQKHPKDKIISSTVRCLSENKQELENEIQEVDRVICCIGRTSGRLDDGTYVNTIDYLETKLNENLRDNLYGPILLANLCQKLDKHLLYIGTGCIFSWNTSENTNKQIFETDKPDFFGSGYSTVKGTTDQLMQLFENVCNCRIRMPIWNADHQRNFISKIVSYSKIHNMPNSMTYLPNMLNVLIELSRTGTTGTFNMTNPGYITHKEILDGYKEHVNSDHTCEYVDGESQLKLLSKRSNNILNTDKLETWCKEHNIELMNIHQCMKHCYSTYNQ
jgi:3,5-epimerase/4-reductase